MTDVLPILSPPPDAPPADVGTPLWWLYRLATKLDQQRPHLQLLDDYYRGHHPLPFVRDPDVKVQFQALLRIAKSNFMRKVITAKAERLKVNGLRLPGDGETADEETWAIWQANGLDAWAPLAFQTALTLGRAYWSVWYPTDGTGGEPTVMVEDPQQVIVEHEPGNRRRRAAGLKMWVDDWTGELHANVYLRTPTRRDPEQGTIYRFKHRARQTNRPEGWEQRDTPIPHNLGIPLIPMVNRPSLNRDPDGESEIDDLLAIQDRINTTILNRMVAEHFAAFPQRWAIGLEDISDDEELQNEFRSSVLKMFISENPAAKFGQFQAADMDNYNKVVEADVQHVSVLSSVPRHYFHAQGQDPSGDAMKSAEASLVADITGTKHMWYGESIEETFALARRAKGLSTPFTSEVVWADPEFRTFGQLVDGLMKLKESGVVDADYVLEKIGETPATIRRQAAARQIEALQAEARALLAPEPEEAA